jgi:hypothetical protein
VTTYNQKKPSAVLVERDEAMEIAGTTPAQFAKLIKQGRLDNCVMYSDRELFSSVQCLAIKTAREIELGLKGKHR